MKKHSLVLLMAFFSVSFLMAQRTVTGVITDPEGEPLIGASVLIKGTTTGTVTEFDGTYSLQVEDGSSILVFSYTGFASQELEVGVSNTIDVILEPGAVLEEIVVTGQGIGIEKKRLTSTVDVITTEQLEQSPITQIDQVLQSRLPGAQVRLSSGQPGTASLIRARGLFSANALSTPVIMIDGVRVDNLNTSPELGLLTGGARSSSLADIPVESIESIEFIRGGAATTLYGADAANGVLQIFTKKGTKGAARFNFETQLGVIEGQDAFLRFPETADLNFENGFSQLYRAGVDGGSDKVTYNFSANYYEDDGFNSVNEQRKVGFRSTISAEVNDQLQYTGSAAFSSNYFTRDYNANTSFARFGNLEGGQFGDLSSATAGFLDTLKQNLAIEGENTNITEFVRRFQTSHAFDYKPFKNFTTRFVFGLDNRTSRAREVGTNALLISKRAESPGTDDQGYIELYNRSFLGLTTDLSFQYKLDLGDFSFITGGGGQLFREQDEQTAIITTNQTEGTLDIDRSAERNANDFLREVVFGGFYISENIGYKNKLFIDAAIRWDGNSAFGSSLGLQDIYRIGLTYSLTDEPFMQSGGISDILTQFKLRANFGQATNFPTPFARDLTFSTNAYLGGNSYTFGNPGNENLGPERVDSYEAGVDFGLFGRGNFRVTYYDNTTVDAIFSPPSPPSSGLAAQESNVGEVINRGWEFEATLNIVQTKDIDFSINASLTTNENEITSAGGAPEFNVGGFTFLGSFVKEGQPLGYLRGGKPTFDAEGNLTDVERNAFLGDPNPNGYGNFGFNFRWKRLTVFGFGDYQYGSQGVNVDDVLRYFNGISDEGRIPANSASESFFDLAGVWVEDANFFKVRNLGVNYTFDPAIIPMDRLQIGFNVLNPFVSASSTFDPEVTGAGIADQGGISVGGFGFGTESAPVQYLFTVRIGL